MEFDFYMDNFRIQRIWGDINYMYIAREEAGNDEVFVGTFPIGTADASVPSEMMQF